MGEPNAARRRIVDQVRRRSVALERARRMTAQAGSGSSRPPRLTIRETEDGLGILVPAVRSTSLVLFLTIWLAGWSAGEWFAISEIIRGGFSWPTLFLVFWLTLWTIGGIGAALVLAWQFVGSERLFVTAGAVVHDYGVGLLRLRKVWRPGEATSFRRATPLGVAYDAGGATRYFGRNLIDSETRTVIDAVARHLPAADANS